MTPVRPPPELVELLQTVPGLFRKVLRGTADVSVYDDAQRVIDQHRSDDFAEWDHLAKYIAQDRAFFRATSQKP